ncbi:hypothetical protein D3C80_1102150 [compost metagenome]
MVVTNITPFAAREPYIAADDASFNTDMLSTSLGLTSFSAPGTPSMTTRGEASFIVPLPRINRSNPSAPGLPEVCAILSPEALPTKAEAKFIFGRLTVDSSNLTLETDPVRFSFFCFP